jgi:hypothetical protein
VAVPVLITLIILFAMRRTIFGPSKKQQQQAADLVATGRKARATILRIEPTGMVVNNINIQCWVTFRLEPLDGGAPFEGRKKMLINQTQMPRAGDVWPSWISPTDPTLFAVGMPDGAQPEQIPVYREFGIPHPLDATAPAPAEDDTVDELQRLAEMRDKGLLSEAEFAAAKAKVLGESS